MKRRIWLDVVFVAAAVGATASLAAAPTKPASKTNAAKPAAAKDWSKAVVATPEGGFRMGNPQAPLKLVEYGSFTCGHCGNFAAEGMPILIRDYVKTGKASLEYRSFVRDPFDMTAALVARCAPPAAFFELMHRIFAGQQQWFGRIQALSAAEKEAISSLDVPDRIVRLAGVAGFEAMANGAGLPAAKVKQCLTDKNAMDRLVAMHETAVKTHGVQGTPSFILNGKLVGAHDWSALQPLLGPPGG